MNNSSKRIICILLILYVVCACTTSRSFDKNTSYSSFKRSNHNRVALQISSKPIEVKYSSQYNVEGSPSFLAGTGAAIFPGTVLVLLIAAPIEHAIRSSKDSTSADSLSDTFADSSIAKWFGDFFISEIEKGKSIEITYLADRDRKSLTTQGYDAIMELEIDQMALIKSITDTQKMRLFTRASGKMVGLRNKEIIWEWSESITRSEEYTFAEYSEESGKRLKELIQKSLRAIAVRMASDILYAP